MHPTRFREELKRFDPKLDLVWNDKKSCWQVVGKDRKNKEYVIYNVPLGDTDKLGPWIIQGLYDATPHKQGGAAAINRMLDAAREREEEQEEKDIADAIDARAEDAWAHLNYREGSRVSMFKPGFVVNDKRRIQTGGRGL